MDVAAVVLGPLVTRASAAAPGDPLAWGAFAKGLEAFISSRSLLIGGAVFVGGALLWRYRARIIAPLKPVTNFLRTNA